MVGRVLVTALLALGTCAPPNAPAPVWPGEVFTPPASYRYLWRWTEQCSGLSGDFDLVEWVVSPHGSLGPHILGRWVPAADGRRARIYLTTWVVETPIERTIKHEILHQLHGYGGHPVIFETCGLL